MTEISPSGRRPQLFLKLLPKLLLVLFVILALGGLALVGLTDFGRGGHRHLRAGLFAEPDWLLHIHRPGKLLTVLSNHLDSDVLADPNWRWLFGLPENPSAALDPDLLERLMESEVLIALRWADPEDPAATDRLLVAFRPESSLLPRLVQLARHRFFYERFVESRIPSGLAPSWVDGLVHLGGIEGQPGLVIGSSRDIVVVGSRFDDVKDYIESQETASDLGFPEETNELELSAVARRQLGDGLERVFGTAVRQSLETLLASGPGSRRVWVDLADSPRLRFEAPATYFDGPARTATGEIEGLRFTSSIRPELFLPDLLARSRPDLGADELARAKVLARDVAGHGLQGVMAADLQEESGITQAFVVFEERDKAGAFEPGDIRLLDDILSPGGITKEEVQEDARSLRSVVIGSWRFPDLPSPPGAALELALRVVGSGKEMTRLVDAIETRRLAREQDPDPAHLARLRSEMSEKLGKIGDADFRYQLQRSLDERQLRVRREMACWRDLLASGIALRARLVDGKAVYELELGR